MQELNAVVLYVVVFFLFLLASVFLLHELMHDMGIKILFCKY